ncbi:MAG: helix-turn-helix domain-containing protein [Bacteroidota bacterium]
MADNQHVATQKKLKKLLGHLDPSSPPGGCPIRDLLAAVTDKWSILIILWLGNYGKLRFNELKKVVQNISSKVLTERLKRMERDGYITRTVYPQVPVKVEYQLSEFGIQYLDQLLNLIIWIDKSAPEIIKRRIKFEEWKPAENKD